MKHMFLVLFAAYLAGNVYVFVRIWKAFFSQASAMQFALLQTPVSKWLFAAFFWFAALSLFIAMFARNLPLPQGFFAFCYNLGSIWLVFTLYMVMILLPLDLLRVVKRDVVLITLVAVALLLLGGYINYRNPRVEKVEIGCDGGGEVQGAGSLKIVAISDVHLGYATGKRALQRYVKLINSQHPDVVLIAGDLIDNDVSPVESARMWEELGQIVAPGGIYMVPGNHEYISGIGKVEKFLEKTPITLLRDSAAVLPGGTVLVGRDDRSNRHRKSMEELIGAVDSLLPDNHSAPVILLEHQPYDIAAKSTMGFDLQIYGHTHRGQIWPMSLLVDRMYEQSHGYRQWGTSHVIVTEGLSLWGPPFRIGTNSNLFVVKLCTMSQQL